jgi:hypothetical protein
MKTFELVYTFDSVNERQKFESLIAYYDLISNQTLPSLHHCAYSIKLKQLELTLELFELLDCVCVYREEKASWCLLEQKRNPIKIQIIENNNNITIPLNIKINNHIGFLFDSPREIIDKVVEWTKTKNIEYILGSWSEKELWIDLPNIFSTFVIEIMHSSIVSPL